MKNSGLFILFLLILFTTTDVHSQTTEASKSLTNILTELQQRFGLQFNYASNLVEDVTVPLPNISLELEDYLQYLELHSDLNYVQVSKNIITIKQKKLVLCGYIKDKDTGENLPFVTVQNGNVGTIANEEGFFEIPIKKNQI